MPVNLVLQDPRISPMLQGAVLKERANKVLQGLGMAASSCSLVLLDDAEMKRYNEQYRQKKTTTNVLAFPADLPPEAIISSATELGDVLISVDRAWEEAKEDEQSLLDRLTRLMIHGILHLTGVDHERSEEETIFMWEQEELLFKLSIDERKTNMTQLAVNVDHIATLRQARGGAEPDPIWAAALCELAGAQGIVAHLREDRRHMQDRDLKLLRQTVKTKLNLEMAMTEEMVAFALDLEPDLVTLVPEKRRELTTEGGLAVVEQEKKIEKTVRRLHKAGIAVSLFIDPGEMQVLAAQQTGADCIELHTGRYSNVLRQGKARQGKSEAEKEARHIAQISGQARAAGLQVNAGHGLDYSNASRIASIAAIEELSIGHAIISRAVFVGLEQAVREMLACMAAGEKNGDYILE